ncbi:hypothetical protein Tco_1212424 [Tanacetum coccineum]
MVGGGPIGEVLNRTSSSSGVKRKDASSGSEMWDAVNYHMGSSPTRVLQKTTFISGLIFKVVGIEMKALELGLGD